MGAVQGVKEDLKDAKVEMIFAVQSAILIIAEGLIESSTVVAMKRCTRQYVLNADVHAKFRLYQMVQSLCTVMIVSLQKRARKQSHLKSATSMLHDLHTTKTVLRSNLLLATTA